ncbi:MAG: metallophosphoesterase [Clostridium sp.]|nr:metallophosphoesterase [Clostridium sp.]
MALYAISDLHLAFNVDKPMDIFGERWLNHDEKIKKNWESKINEEDTVLIAGDISWSMRAEDSKYDLDWIDKLPGKKIISKGNHDYWWQSISKLNKMYENTKFIQNNFYSYEDYAICGTRGWTSPDNDKFTQHDRKIYDRELIRLRLSLDMAKNAGYSKFIVMVHYPPTNENYDETEFTKVFKAYGVEKVIYGHLHGPSNFKIKNDTVDGVEYINTSCDFINFDPIKLL